VGEAGGTDEFRRLDPESPGSVLRRVKRELIVVGGLWQLRESVGVEETDGNKIQGVASCMPVDDHKGANVAPRGVRDFCEKETLKGEPGTVVARNKATKLGPARKPLRG
jgi:hypothetical protein